ncbi:hypothetical protein HUG15_06360 [Salicibibacter cibarius]|uniref:DUF5067 domain-containing protein n=1 Tax=Salicibibacter cibarius TaxID=2743000 RepID=A0A7T6Z1H9_9BACI|nr:hypothetical protein [Salicibibacter cibarius]QQK75250.1 hypothetical protein HUG15_06360 [Salicibibacter cibarius]
MSEEIVKKPFYKRWWFFVIIGILIIGAIGNEDEESASQEEENEEEVNAEALEDEDESEEYDLISNDPLDIAEEILGDDYKDGSSDDGGTSVKIDYGDPFFSGQRGFERDIENILEQYHHLDETPDSAFYLLDDNEDIVFSYEFAAEDVEEMDEDEGIDDIQSFAATYYEREEEGEDDEDSVEEPIDLTIESDESIFFMSFSVEADEVHVYEEDDQLLMDFRFYWTNNLLSDENDEATFLMASGIDVHQSGELLDEVAGGYSDTNSNVYREVPSGGARATVDSTYELKNVEDVVEISFIPRSEYDENQGFIIDIEDETITTND